MVAIFFLLRPWCYRLNSHISPKPGEIWGTRRYLIFRT
jgi:hypothetical protein